ncbi:MAG TPA: hypothetical protein VKO63_01775 [Chitinispirillaceae bacterium]|nr:hypothetical protein [Chitinispirillaceae bacterium]
MYRIVPLVLLSFYLLFAETSPDSSALFYLDKSTLFLSSNQIDSAIYYLDISRNAGLSKDSFLYHYATIYLEKGVLDTALAFNYALKPEKTSPLYKSKFEQRYLIFSLLGLKDEAVKAFDSLGIVSEPVQKNRISFPKLSLSVGETYKQAQENTSDDDPLLQTMKKSTTSGFGTDLSASIKWDIPWPKRDRFTIGTSYTNTESSDHKADSLAHSWSAFLQINNLGPFAASYTFSRDKSLSQSYTSSNALNLSLFIPDSSYTKIGGFSLNGKFTLSHSELTQQIYSLFGFFDTKITSHYSLNINIFFIAMLIDKSVIDHTLPVSNISGSDFLGNNMKIITKPDVLTDLYIGRITQAQRDTTIVLFQIPNSTISISPSFDNTFSIFWKLSLKVSLGYSLSLYTEDYIWYNPKDPDIALARDVTTGKLYNINSLSVSGVSIDTLERQEFRKRRIDNAFQIGITLSRPVWRIGDFSIGGTYEKVFSNMSDYSPVAIPDWTFECSAVLSINIPLRK